LNFDLIGVIGKEGKKEVKRSDYLQKAKVWKITLEKKGSSKLGGINFQVRFGRRNYLYLLFPLQIGSNSIFKVPQNRLGEE